MRKLVIVGVLAALVACDRDSDDDPLPPAPGERPVAVAGDDFEAVLSAAGLVLDGTKSYDPPGDPLTAYEWTQTSGTPVVITNATMATATFDAPAAPETLVFQLKVTGKNGTDIDEVMVTVKTVVVAAPDTWFVGYGLSGETITAVPAGGTGPYTYSWTNIPDWLTVTGGTTSATLTFDTPLLTDLMKLDDEAGVAMLQRYAQGRVQLTVTVTDNNAFMDSDLVNLSIGPFPATVANENVGLGEPVFLNGGDGGFTMWTWTGTKPNGSPITFFKPDKTALAAATDQRIVYFVPDLAGLYQVIVTQNPGTVIKVIEVVSGSYVGVGNQLGKTPNPFKGECAACHAGQFPTLANFADTWKQTAHASAFSETLEAGYSHYAAMQVKPSWKDLFDFGSSFDISERTTGFSLASSEDNDGWDERATDEGFVHGGITWPEMIRRHPRTAGLSNVQCESCHGPGGQHAGDSEFIRKSYDATLCGRCHGDKREMWDASHHGHPAITGRTSCNNCHTAQGYVFDMRSQEGAAPYDVLTAISNIGRPELAAKDQRGTTCQTCHEPHKRTFNATFGDHDPQLRAFGDVRFINGAVVNAGVSANCFMCHNGRRDSTPNSDHWNQRRGPHHGSTAAEMLTGNNGSEFPGWTYTNSPHGDPGRFISPVDGTNRQCATCHMDVTPPKGAIGHGALGGHTFAMKQGSGMTEADEASNAGGATVAGTRKFTVAGGPGFLRKLFPGDILTITTGTDTGAYTVAAVNTNRQVTLGSGPAFTGGAATAWSINSVPKYNVASCTQCHTTALDFRDVARGDYDGDFATEAVQDEIAGLLAALQGAIEARLQVIVGPGTTLNAGSSIRYYKNGTSTRYTFPGPAVSSGSNPDFIWDALTPAEQAEWENLYRAAFNLVFVEADGSGGIHNTGYAVNLLQSSYQAVTGMSIGDPFVPFP